MTNVYYIHGFNSSPHSETFYSLKMLVPRIEALTYDYTDPSGSLKKLHNYLSDKEDIVLIGSSLGGWYAEELSKRLICDLVLYNPSTVPSTSLKKYGVSSDVLQKYEECSSTNRISHPRRHVILCTDDEVIPYNIAEEKYKNNSAIVHMTGGHRSTVNSIKEIAKTVEYLSNTF